MRTARASSRSRANRSEPAICAKAALALTEKWRPEKLWDTHTPQNQYELSISLLDARGEAVDTTHPVRFGFREFWIDGRDFYLNGSRIFLSAVPLDNAQIGAALASYDGARESLKRLQSFGINFVYTHNYGCQPGSHLGFAEILRAADDVGMLVALSQPHFSRLRLADAGRRPDQRLCRARGVLRAAWPQPHPSVVMYSMSHNATGYNEDMNPDLIDGIYDQRNEWAMNNVRRALRAEAIVRRLDPSRDRLPSLVGQPELDAHEQLLPQLRPDPGTVRLVRALGDAGRQAVLRVRIRGAVCLGLGDVPRLVQGQPGIRQRRRAVGVLPGGMERPVPGRCGLSDQRAGETQPALGGRAVPQRAVMAPLGLSAPAGLDRLRRTLPRAGQVPDRQLAGVPHLGRVGDFALGASTCSGSCAPAWIETAASS